MAEDKKKPRKPVVGSRAPASAPRKVAGRTTRPEPTEPNPPTEMTASTEPTVAPPPPSPPSPSPLQKTAKPARSGGVLTSQTTTWVLVGVLSVLVLVGGVLSWNRWLDDDSAAGVDPSDCYAADKDYEIPDHPVSVPDLDWRAAREASTQAVVKILTANWKTYDKHVEDAQKLMTREWAQKEYLNTARDTRQNFLKNKADYKFAVVGESVVCASRDEITSLLFLNQYVYKGTGDDRVGPDIYQVRVIVTAVREGETWLVDRLDAL